MGLTRAAEANWAWIEVGFEESKNPGSASFWSPAKVKVPPRKSRKGNSAQPAMEVANGGGPSRPQARRHPPESGGATAMVVFVRSSLVRDKAHHPLAAGGSQGITPAGQPATRRPPLREVPTTTLEFRPTGGTATTVFLLSVR